jgi:hypothetical protein
VGCTPSFLMNPTATTFSTQPPPSKRWLAWWFLGMATFIAVMTIADWNRTDMPAYRAPLGIALSLLHLGMAIGFWFRLFPVRVKGG